MVLLLSENLGRNLIYKAPLSGVSWLSVKKGGGMKWPRCILFEQN